MNIQLRGYKKKNQLQREKEAAEKLEQARRRLDIAQRKGDWAEASRIQYVVIPELEKLLQNREIKLTMMSDAVTSDEIAVVISKSTGIPIQNLLLGEREKLLNLETYLSERVIGQPRAVSAVSNALRISRAGLHTHQKPLGTFMFMGPTGVGKTELCEVLSEFMFNTQQAIIRIDMSEYMEKFSITRLIGAPPGYVGYEDAGTLTEAVRRRPYSLILFDEFEKAHRDVSNLLLQVLDEGSLTDSQGRKVDFKNTIIIMTSNIGADILASLPEGSKIDEVEDTILQEMSKYMAPEFINRIDDIVFFDRLSIGHMGNILELQLKIIKHLLNEKKRFS